MQFLQLAGLGFVTLGPFHCASFVSCVYLCVFCVFFVSYCIVVVLRVQWDGPDGIEA